MNQLVFQKLLDKYRENKLSHAFLLETNDINKCWEELNEFIKRILCDFEFDKQCKEECNICYMIDKRSLPSVLTIEPDGASIKKNQILELKEKMKNKAIYTKMNIYIIINAEKMTLSSANTMLKFLEEPNGQVLGFFITDNKERIIETIRSRCQIITINYDQNLLYGLQISEEKFLEYKKSLNKFVRFIETDINEAFIKSKNIVLKDYSDRNEFSLLFQLLLKIYEAKLLRKDEFDEFNYIIENNSSKNIIKKMKIIERLLNKLNFNPNLELVLDKFIIEMREIYE